MSAMKSALKSKADRAAWARLCKRFPELQSQVDHCACIMAAQAEGKINVRVHVALSIGGWVSAVIGYSPALEGCTQTFALNRDDDYPSRFTSMVDATEAAMREKENLRKALEEVQS